MPDRVGPGRVLATCYAVFVVAAGARSAVQLGLHAGRAPLAYALSALAAAVYATGLALVLRVERGSARSARLARACCVLELLGVLTVGFASRCDPSAFPEPTVWSDFGAGYGFVPLVLPVVALAWLKRSGVCCGQPAGTMSPWHDAGAEDADRERGGAERSRRS